MKSVRRNEDAFTGLEAAIVLIAFVVVAAVFSYVVLGAGFFTTQKSQETVHTAVGQASSAVEIVGNLAAKIIEHLCKFSIVHADRIALLSPVHEDEAVVPRLIVANAGERVCLGVGEGCGNLTIHQQLRPESPDVKRLSGVDGVNIRALERIGIGLHCAVVI